MLKILFSDSGDFKACKPVNVFISKILLQNYNPQLRIEIVMTCLWTILRDESQTVVNSPLSEWVSYHRFCSSPMLNPTYLPTYLYHLWIRESKEKKKNIIARHDAYDVISTFRIFKNSFIWKMNSDSFVFRYSNYVSYISSKLKT